AVEEEDPDGPVPAHQAGRLVAGDRQPVLLDAVAAEPAPGSERPARLPLALDREPHLVAAAVDHLPRPGSLEPRLGDGQTEVEPADVEVAALARQLQLHGARFGPVEAEADLAWQRHADREARLDRRESAPAEPARIAGDGAAAAPCLVVLVRRGRGAPHPSSSL